MMMIEQLEQRKEMLDNEVYDIICVAVAEEREITDEENERMLRLVIESNQLAAQIAHKGRRSRNRGLAAK